MLLSWSAVAVMSEEQKKKLESTAREILAKGEGKIWVDKEKGIFEIENETAVNIFRKK